ncbi:restriction endonuclease subunit S [Campylobacter upsaliensis]
MLKLALEGSLSKLYRRSSPTLSAFDEIATYNDEIRQKRKDLEKELKKLESTLKKVGKRDFSFAMQTQNAVSLENDKKACHTDLECSEREVSKNTESQLVIFASVGKSFARASECEKSTKELKQILKSQIQSLKKEIAKCKEITPLFCQESRFFANAQNDKKACHTASTCHTECSEVSQNTESKRDFSPTAQNAVSLENDNPHTPPFEIPNSWAWVKLGDICEMKKGPFGSAITKDMFIPNGSNAVKIYEQKNAIQKSETLGEYYISLEHFEKLKQFEVFENDIIVSCAGTIGEIFRIPKNAPKGIINQALMKIKLVNEEWIPYFMIFFDFLIKQKSQENSKGSAIKNIPPLDILKNFTIPLPPLKEQEHIAQTLDTLFTLKKGLRVD